MYSSVQLFCKGKFLTSKDIIYSKKLSRSFPKSSNTAGVAASLPNLSFGETCWYKGVGIILLQLRGIMQRKSRWSPNPGFINPKDHSEFPHL